ncbi:MAG: DUF3566 domain-containing protein [Acidimicrobiales bacterium]
MSADQPGLAAASDATATSVGDEAQGRTTHYPPAPGTRRSRAARFISDRLSPPAMPASPPVLDGPPVTAAPPREVDLPPAPPTRSLSESEQVAAAQAARAAEARVATVAPPRPEPSPPIDGVTFGAGSMAAAAALVPPVPVAEALAAPLVAPTLAPPATPRTEPRRRPVRALPPGETGVVVEEERGRRLSRREQRQLGRLRAKKVKRVVRHIEPWSVFKISLIFNVCLFITFMVAGTLLWSLAISAGTIDNFLDFINDLVGGELTIEGETIFRASLYGGAVMVIANSLFMVLLVVLFNLISDLVGGIRITVIEEENVRRAAPATPPGRTRV